MKVPSIFFSFSKAYNIYFHLFSTFRPSHSFSVEIFNSQKHIVYLNFTVLKYPRHLEHASLENCVGGEEGPSAYNFDVERFYVHHILLVSFIGCGSIHKVQLNLCEFSPPFDVFLIKKCYTFFMGLCCLSPEKNQRLRIIKSAISIILISLSRGLFSSLRLEFFKANFGI